MLHASKYDSMTTRLKFWGRELGGLDPNVAVAATLEPFAGCLVTYASAPCCCLLRLRHCFAHLQLPLTFVFLMLPNTPSIPSTLQENVRAIRAVLDRVEAIKIPSHAASPIIHIHLRSATSSASAKAPRPQRLVRRRRSTLRVRSACCRTLWTMCLRRACGFTRARGIAWAGARRDAAEHPSRCHGGAVAQGVRAGGGCY